MTTFVEEFQKHLLSGESLEQTADWYFNDDQADARINDDRHYDDMTPQQRAFFDYLNNEVFAKAIEEMRAERRAREAMERATDLAGRSS
jgi:hypothetical protein